MKYVKCGLCNRILKNIKSQQLGFGAICYKKYLRQFDKEQPSLFDILDNKKYNKNSLSKLR